ncbi:unnamed protein product [Lathyrus oleraceus]
MVSCVDFFLSLTFGTLVKRFVTWSRDKPNTKPQHASNKSTFTTVERDLPGGHNY